MKHLNKHSPDTYAHKWQANTGTGTQEPEHLENENQGYWVSTLYSTGHWASNSNENRLGNGCLQGCELLNGTATAKQTKKTE